MGDDDPFSSGRESDLEWDQYLLGSIQLCLPSKIALRRLVKNEIRKCEKDAMELVRKVSHRISFQNRKQTSQEVLKYCLLDILA